MSASIQFETNLDNERIKTETRFGSEFVDRNPTASHSKVVNIFSCLEYLPVNAKIHQSSAKCGHELKFLHWIICFKQYISLKSQYNPQYQSPQRIQVEIKSDYPCELVCGNCYHGCNSITVESINIVNDKNWLKRLRLGLESESKIT